MAGENDDDPEKKDGDGEEDGDDSIWDRLNEAYAARADETEAKLKAAREERDAKHAELDAQTAALRKLFKESRTVELAEPTWVRPGWETHAAVRGAELVEQGFRHFMYYHNVTYTEAGKPNLRVCYLSPDGCTSATITFFLARRTHEPGPDAKFRYRKTDPMEETRSINISTMFEGPRWLETCTDNHWSCYPDPIIANFLPAGATIEEMWQSHLRVRSSPEWAGLTPVPVDTFERFCEAGSQQHHVLTTKPNKIAEELNESQKKVSEILNNQRSRITDSLQRLRGNADEMRQRMRRRQDGDGPAPEGPSAQGGPNSPGPGQQS